MMPAGRYYVGDPCYVLGDEYDVFLDALWKAEEAKGTGPRPGAGQFEWAGAQLAVFSTAYGDGYYFDREGRGYSVDAGIIGAIPAGLVEPGKGDGGHFIEFKSPFEVSWRDGTLIFGDVEIHTGEDPDNEG